MGSKPPSRIGLLGGTFDPPHYGHLLIAQEAAEVLGLDRVLFLPARQNPLKAREEVTAAHQRVAMVSLAIQDNPRFELSVADLDRPPPSYTVDLLRLLKNELGDTELFFLGGADLLSELPLWHEPEEILKMAVFVAATRPGWPQPSGEGVARAIPSAADRVVVLNAPGIDISSTSLRERARCGRSLRYLTPPAIEQYILEQGLYARD